jgi:hypothetical protein
MMNWKRFGRSGCGLLEVIFRDFCGGIGINRAPPEERLKTYRCVSMLVNTGNVI